jgi:hypothetical protein
VSEPRPASWLVIERGWDVVGSDGTRLGSVREVLGDSGKDIFNGLSVSPGALRGSRYVAAERVTEIVEGSIRLDLSADEFERLENAGPVPPSAEIRADTSDL